MLLRRQPTVTHVRASSGVFHPRINMSSIHDVQPHVDRLHKGFQTSKVMTSTWDTVRGIIFQSGAAQERRQALSSDHSLQSPASIEGVQYSEHGDRIPDMKIAQGSSATTYESLMTRKSASFVSKSFRSSLPRPLSILSGHKARAKRNRGPIMLNDLLFGAQAYHFYNRQLGNDISQIKRLLEGIAALHPRGSPTSLYLYDLRDELLFSTSAICYTLQYCRKLHTWRHPLSQEVSSELASDDLCNTPFRLDLLRTLQREVQDSRHLILQYARLIDRFYASRNMHNQVDDILGQIIRLTPITDSPFGHYAIQLPPLGLADAVYCTKNTLRSLLRHIGNLRFLTDRFVPYARIFIEQTHDLHLALDSIIQSSWVRSPAGCQARINGCLGDSHKEESEQMLLLENHQNVSGKQLQEAGVQSLDSNSILSTHLQNVAGSENAKLGSGVSANRSELECVPTVSEHQRNAEDMLEQWSDLVENRRVTEALVRSFGEVIDRLRELANEIDGHEIKAIGNHQWSELVTPDLCRRLLKFRDSWESLNIELERHRALVNGELCAMGETDTNDADPKVLQARTSSKSEHVSQVPWPKDAQFKRSTPARINLRPTSRLRTAHSEADTSVDRRLTAYQAKSHPESWENRLKQWPDFCKCRRLCFDVEESLGRLIKELRTPIDGRFKHIDMRQLLLYAMESYHWLDEFIMHSYHVRIYIRLREEWDDVTDCSQLWNRSSALSILHRLRNTEKRKASIAFAQSRRTLFSAFQELDLCQRLYRIYSKKKLDLVCRDIFNPWNRSALDILSLIYGMSTEQGAGAYKRLVVDFARINHLSQELLDGWLQPSGYSYRDNSIIDKVRMKRDINRCRMSMSGLRYELSKQSESSVSIVSMDPLSHDSINSRPRSHLDGSPVYLPDKGQEGSSLSSGPSKTSPQTSWSKKRYLHTGPPAANTPTVVNSSRPKRAAMHTTAIAEYPAASALTTLEPTEAMDESTEPACDASRNSRSKTTSPLGYHIPLAKMRESMLASKTSRSAYWQYTLYEGLKGEKVRVHYCKSLETTERISKLFLNESVIGFDVEWKPMATVKEGIRKNVSTIQLASEERIALFHVARFSKGDRAEDLVAPSFKQIMESTSITKVGVSVKSDCTRLRKFMDIDSRGLFELSHLYKLVKFASDDVKKINKKLVSLATQVEEHLMLPMYKDQSVRASDWSEDLNYEQIYCISTLMLSGVRGD